MDSYELFYEDIKKITNEFKKIDKKEEELEDLEKLLVDGKGIDFMR